MIERSASGNFSENRNNWNNNKNNIILRRFLCTTYQRHPRDSCRFSFRCLSKGRRSGVYNESLMGEESEIFDPDC